MVLWLWKRIFLLNRSMPKYLGVCKLFSNSLAKKAKHTKNPKPLMCKYIYECIYIFASMKGILMFIVLLFQLFSRFKVFQIKGYGGGRQGGGEEWLQGTQCKSPWRRPLVFARLLWRFQGTNKHYKGLLVVPSVCVGGSVSESSLHHVGENVDWGVRQTCSNPCSVPSWLCNLGQVTKHFWPSVFLFVKREIMPTLQEYSINNTS